MTCWFGLKTGENGMNFCLWGCMLSRIFFSHSRALGYGILIWSGGGFFISRLWLMELFSVFQLFAGLRMILFEGTIDLIDIEVTSWSLGTKFILEIFSRYLRLPSMFWFEGYFKFLIRNVFFGAVYGGDIGPEAMMWESSPECGDTPFMCGEMLPVKGSNPFLMEKRGGMSLYLLYTSLYLECLTLPPLNCPWVTP